jgi:hypothetical protein
MKKQVLAYILSALGLGVFQGVLMSMGSFILPSIGMSVLFWLLMLTPMLSE